MTKALEDLMKYAKDAKEEHQRRVEDKQNRKDESISLVIKKAIDILKEMDGSFIWITQRARTFLIDSEEVTIEEGDLQIEELKEVIDSIPDLDTEGSLEHRIRVCFSKE